jgi:hypothetical protein
MGCPPFFWLISASLWGMEDSSFFTFALLHLQFAVNLNHLNKSLRSEFFV